MTIEIGSNVKTVIITFFICVAAVYMYAIYCGMKIEKNKNNKELDDAS